MASSSKAEQLADALNDLLATSPNAEAAAVVSYDGLTMASALPPEMDEERLGAMSAALLGLGEQAALGLGRGELNQLFVEGDDGFVFLMSAQDQAVLAVITDSQAKIGFALFEMRRAARTIGEVLGSDDAPVDWDVADGALADPADAVLEAAAGPQPIDEQAAQPSSDLAADFAADLAADLAAEVTYDQHDEADEDDSAVTDVTYVPQVAEPYQPGPIPADLASNPYFLAPRVWATDDAQDESK